MSYVSPTIKSYDVLSTDKMRHEVYAKSGVFTLKHRQEGFDGLRDQRSKATYAQAAQLAQATQAARLEKMQAYAEKIPELVEKILSIGHTSIKCRQLKRDLATQANLLAQLELGALATPKAIKEMGKKISLDAIRIYQDLAPLFEAF